MVRPEIESAFHQSIGFTEPPEVYCAGVQVAEGQFIPFERQTFWPFTVRLVKTALVADKLVVVTEVAVAFTKLRPPRTVKVEVTVEDAATKPPNRLRVAVVVAPVAVTVFKFGVVTAEQLVPSARQTDWPLATKLVKTAFVANKFVVVADVPVEFPKMKF